MLFGLFNSNKNKIPFDVSVLKTDMHSHLIPGVDDGVKTIDESLKMIRGLKEAGFSKLITTPHIMYDYYKNNKTNITEGLSIVKEAVYKESINIEIEAAAEYLVDDGFEELFRKGELMTFGDRFVLTELSYYNMYHGFFSLIFDMHVEGYKIILAHPERYSYFHNNFNALEDIKARGVYFQLNTISLSGYYSSKVQKIAEKIIDAGFYEFAGSDIHNEEYLFNFRKSLYNPHLKKLFDSGKLKNHLL